MCVFAQASDLVKLTENFILTYLLNKDIEVIKKPVPPHVLEEWERGEVFEGVSFGSGLFAPAEVRLLPA